MKRNEACLDEREESELLDLVRVGVARSQQKDLDARVFTKTAVRKGNHLPENLLVSAGVREEVTDLRFPALLLWTGESR